MSELQELYESIRKEKPVQLDENFDPSKANKIKLISFLTSVVKVSEKFMKRMTEEDLRLMAVLFLRQGKAKLDRDLAGEDTGEE